MKKTFYSNGKLLITSEYLVLDGAKALALPTKFGQDLTVERIPELVIQWTSYDYNREVWFETIISFQEIQEKVRCAEQSERNTLIRILQEALVLNPEFLNHSDGFKVQTQLGFSRSWGLGTSSTLINNIAQWWQIDAYLLLKNSFGGSGYDIACAQNNLPIVYRLAEEKPEVKLISFYPDCASNIYFLYLNQKQSSKEAIENYRSKTALFEDLVPYFDTITETIIEKNDYETFCKQFKKHETKMSEVLSLPMIQDRLFSDFDGTVKSLGAWGGDFVMVISKNNPAAYFRNKGFETILPYKEMIL